MGRRRLVRIGAITLSLAGQNALAQPVPPPQSQVSAHCVGRVYATDRLVCTNPDLRALDAEMLELWTLVAELRRQSQADQVAWFRRRSLCAFDPDHRACAMTAYRERIATLRAALDQP